MALRVLITNLKLDRRTGTELYVRDLALELLRRGHSPIVYTPRPGEISDQLRQASVPIAERLQQIATPPDIVHGHHSLETAAALLHFPHTPGVFVCHDCSAWHDTPPKLPHVYRYLAVDHVCRERLVHAEGIAAENVEVIYNAVDLDRFPPRGPLPERPQRALLISNNVRPRQVAMLRRVCAAASLELETAGMKLGGVCSHPELAMRRSDLVFAKGRCAWEALAVGAAVIVCDAEGVGPLVTLDRLEALRRLNFGRRLLRETWNAETLAREIARYQATDGMQVSRQIRATTGMPLLAEQLEAVYQQVIEQHRHAQPPDAARQLQAAAEILHWHSARQTQLVYERAAAMSILGRLRRFVRRMRAAA